MSVLKKKQKASSFQVFHNLYKLRQNVTALLLRDFGYSFEKQEQRLYKYFGCRNFSDLNESEKARYDRLKNRWTSFEEWFIQDERKAIVDCLRDITTHVYLANSIYPTCMEEYIQRRIHQDEAIGQCNRLDQELHYAIETLPVDVNIYLQISREIQTEINLIKGWRQSDNKLKPRATSEQLPVSSAYFANVNNDGNCNYDNASNANGVRPDFETTVK